MARLRLLERQPRALGLGQPWLESVGRGGPEPPGPTDPLDDDAVAPDAPVAWQLEWDRLIRRLRPDWCRVIEQGADAVPADPAGGGPPAVARRCEVPLRRLLQPHARDRLARDGERLDLDAPVPWCAARRSHRRPDGRVYRRREVGTGRAAVVLLIDQSASTAAGDGVDGGSLLQASARVAWAMAHALRRLDVPCTIVAFRSNGRRAVHLRVVKSPTDPVDAGLAARLGALRSGGSTRLGAAVRHLTARLAQARAGQRLLLRSDGEAHDIDVHDPRHLVDDLPRALRRLLG